MGGPPAMELHVEGFGARHATRLASGQHRDVYLLVEPFPAHPELLVAKLEVHPADDSPAAVAAVETDLARHISSASVDH